MKKKEIIRILTGVALGAMAGVILYLYLNIAPGADGPYPYTIKKIFSWAFYPLALLAILLLFFRPLGIFFKWAMRNSALWGFLAALSFVFIGVLLFLFPGETIPWPQSRWLSAGWLCAYFFLSFFLGAWAARLNNWASSPLSVCALLALGFAMAEAHFFVFPPRWYASGFYQDNATSKYVLAGEAQTALPMVQRPYGEFTGRPAHPSASTADHQLREGVTQYDVRYTFDDNGHRITPAANEKPEADLLLFGCSYTFGYALENDETWAWRLSELLGPRWLVTNYAFMAFGAQQMLTLLEEKAISEPEAPVREAVFLAFQNHLYRFSGLFPVPLKCVRYDLRNGQLVRDGFNSDSPYYFFSVTMPQTLKGSQAALQLSVWLTGKFIGLENERLTKIYLAMLEKSARLLREEYATDLTILLWPDMEHIRGDLEKAGIKSVLASEMLKDYPVSGLATYVEERLMVHPNPRATQELAAGLYEYLKKKDPGAVAGTQDLH